MCKYLYALVLIQVKTFCCHGHREYREILTSISYLKTTQNHPGHIHTQPTFKSRETDNLTFSYSIHKRHTFFFFFNKRHTFKGKVERYAQCRKLSNSAIQEQQICVLNALNVQNEVTEVHVGRVLMGL